VIFEYDKGQKAAALKSKEKEQKRIKTKIVTEILPAQAFYTAEEYHQKYLLKRGKNTC
jgi:peptide methionine sulfoxide reductase MsrA